MKFAWKQIAVAISCMAMGLLLAAMGASAQTKGAAASAEEARKFIEGAEQQLFDLAVKGSRASWVEENFITEDTEQIAANANEELNTAAAKFAKEAHRFDSVQLSSELARKRMLLELATARRSQSAKGTGANSGLAGWRLWKGKMVSRRRREAMP